MSADQLTDDAASWLAEVRRWGPRRLEAILAADPVDVYGLLTEHIHNLDDKARRVGVRRSLGLHMIRLEEIRSLARLVPPVCGDLPPVAAIAARGLRSPGLVEWVWSIGGS